MFLCGVARLRYDTNKKKIGIWPIGKWEPVKWSSKKHAKGTPVWMNQCIMQDVYQEYLIQKLLPAIKQRWPTNNGRIQLQQDGAISHILEDDEEFKEAVDEIGLNLIMYTQLPNSPDTNILDLGFSELYSRSTMIALPMKKNWSNELKRHMVSIPCIS